MPSPSRFLKFFLNSLIVILLWAVLVDPALAKSKYRVLYAFKGGTDGANPSGALTRDASGNVYGTTYAGGQNQTCTNVGIAGCGTVFELKQDSKGKWQEISLYSFQDGKDGANPNGTMIFDEAGNLWGTTEVGGEGTSYGCGTIFKMTPNSGVWTESVAYTFCSGFNDGYFPNPGLTLDSSGNLYGTTGSGGSSLGGVAFELTPGSGGFTSTSLYSFCLIGNCFVQGTNPTYGFVVDAPGTFYGTTSQGGSYANSCGGFPGGCGVVYELKLDAKGNWVQRVIHAFQGPEGVQPFSRVTLDPQGNLYGTTQNDGAFGFGTIFKLTRGTKGHWRYSVLHNFRTGLQYGESANSSVLIDGTGNLYGSVGAGGIGSCPGGVGCGMVYRLSPGKSGRWHFTPLHKFRGSEGAVPNGDLIMDAQGNLYGVTAIGGMYGAGVVYEVTP